MHSRRRSNARALAWACYLACSWTWCIGMFLPILIVRDYGLWGFVVFAAPNVLGAAAFAFVLAHDNASESLVRAHAGAMRAFSAVTLTFHGFFIAWLMSGLLATYANRALAFLPLAAVFLLPPLAGLAAGGAMGANRQRRLAIWTMALSLAAAGIFVAAQLASGRLFSGAPGEPLRHPDALLWLAPVVFFGFALCPYLDLTFHRARREMHARDARLAFAFGFGVLFLTMILFSLAYADIFLAGRTRNWLIWIVVLHIVLQTTFTCALHAREFRAGPPPAPVPLPSPMLLVAVGMAAGFLAGGSIFVPSPASGAELVYRLFMGFYALVFPAYVWLVMIPTRDGHAGLAGPRGRRKMRILCLAVGLAAPMLWMGFIRHQEAWLAPAMLIVLLARLFLPRRTP